MTLALLFMGLKLRENKRYPEAQVYFDFLMRFDRELEFLGRFLSLLSFLECKASSGSKKFSSFSAFKGKILIRDEQEGDIYSMKFDSLSELPSPVRD